MAASGGAAVNTAGPALRDIHLPAAAWWPLAPGWWIVLGLVVLALVASVLVGVRRRHRRMLRVALHAIGQLQTAQQSTHDGAELVAQASQLLRRVALQVEPHVASTDGAEWRAFVQRYARSPSTREVMRRLLDERFRPAPTLEAATLLPALRDWCRAALGRKVPRSAPRRRRAVGVET